MEKISKKVVKEGLQASSENSLLDDAQKELQEEAEMAQEIFDELFGNCKNERDKKILDLCGRVMQTHGALKKDNLPDPSISIKDMHEYGYTWEGMLPLKEAAALYLFEKEGMRIFRLYADGTEAAIVNDEDLKNHTQNNGIFGVHKESWDALCEYRAKRRKLKEDEVSKEALLLYGKEETYGIYQLKHNDETRSIYFRPYNSLQAAGLAVNPDNYELIYTGPLKPDMSLESIWEKFNLDHPKDFIGHSLSVSDIVVLHRNGSNTAYYVDMFGYQEVPEFLRLRNLSNQK